MNNLAGMMDQPPQLMLMEQNCERMDENVTITCCGSTSKVCFKNPKMSTNMCKEDKTVKVIGASGFVNYKTQDSSGNEVFNDGRMYIRVQPEIQSASGNPRTGNIGNEQYQNTKQWYLPGPNQNWPRAASRLNNYAIQLSTEYYSPEFRRLVQDKYQYWRPRKVTYTITNAHTWAVSIAVKRNDSLCEPTKTKTPDNMDAYKIPTETIAGDVEYFTIAAGQKLIIEVEWPSITLNDEMVVGKMLKTKPKTQSWRNTPAYGSFIPQSSQVLQIPTISLQLTAPGYTSSQTDATSSMVGVSVEWWADIDVMGLETEVAPYYYAPRLEEQTKKRKLEEDEIIIIPPSENTIDHLREHIEKVEGETQKQILQLKDQMFTEKLKLEGFEDDLKAVGHALGQFAGAFIHEGVSRLILSPIGGEEVDDIPIDVRVEQLESAVRKLCDYYIGEGTKRQETTPKNPLDPNQMERQSKYSVYRNNAMEV